MEGCSKSNCIKQINSKNYLNPYIIFKETDILNKENIVSQVNKLMTNEITQCTNDIMNLK